MLRMGSRVITGRALFEGKLDLAAAIAMANKE
jgi:phosphoribosylformimino-5-aminoimidazole carboxamide ribonucleotide (ProFAR) isomerase